MNLAAFLSYIILTAFTPGPNTIMAMSNSARDGFRKAMVFCLGVSIGFFIDMVLCALFTALLFQYIPAVAPVLKWVGAAYILFLAYTILRDKPPAPQKNASLAPGGLFTGVVMQFVNVKVILYGITALSTFVLPHTQTLTGIAAAVLVLTLTGFAGTCCWALFGALFQRVFAKQRRILNLIMALLLVYCAIASLLS